MIEILIALVVLVVAWVAAGILSDKVLSRKSAQEDHTDRSRWLGPDFLMPRSDAVRSARPEPDGSETPAQPDAEGAPDEPAANEAPPSQTE